MFAIGFDFCKEKAKIHISDFQKITMPYENDSQYKNQIQLVKR